MKTVKAISDLIRLVEEKDNSTINLPKKLKQIYYIAIEDKIEKDLYKGAIKNVIDELQIIIKEK